MSSVILNPFLTFAESPIVESVLRVLAVLLGMARESKQDKELTACTQHLNDCQERLRESEEKREKADSQRDVVIVALVVVIAIVVIASLNYRMVPRSLPG
jgi:hypothetical protein